MRFLRYLLNDSRTFILRSSLRFRLFPIFSLLTLISTSRSTTLTLVSIHTLIPARLARPFLLIVPLHPLHFHQLPLFVNVPKRIKRARSLALTPILPLTTPTLLVPYPAQIYTLSHASTAHIVSSHKPTPAATGAANALAAPAKRAEQHKRAQQEKTD